MKCLFSAHPTAVQLTRRYHSVFLLDCICKTNQFRLPLLNIVGVAPTNDTFFSCFCLLSRQTLDDYSWALHTFRRLLTANHPLPEVMVTDREMALINSIEQTFPAVKHILCKWHLERNILAMCPETSLMTTNGSFSFSRGTRWFWFSRGTKPSSMSNGELSALHSQPFRACSTTLIRCGCLSKSASQCHGRRIISTWVTR